jgi:hypothetical protein
MNGAPGDPYLLLQIEVEYETHNPLGRLPVIGSMPRYLVAARNALQKEPVTLNPYETRTRFPLIAKNGEAPILSWHVFGLLPGASITMKSVSVSVISTAPANRWWFAALVENQRTEMKQ